MKTCADGKRGEKGGGGEGCVGDDDPTGGKRDGGKLAACAVRHEGGRKRMVQRSAPRQLYMHRGPAEY